MQEKEMVQKGIQFFLNEQKFKWIKQEVPFFERSIDVLLLDKKDNLISIEFKMNDWKHAIQQAMDHKNGSDFAYICLPKKKIPNDLPTILDETGIGLMMYNNETNSVENIIDPRPKQTVLALKNLLLKMADRIPSVY